MKYLFIIIALIAIIGCGNSPTDSGSDTWTSAGTTYDPTKNPDNYEIVWPSICDSLPANYKDCLVLKSEIARLTLSLDYYISIGDIVSQEYLDIKLGFDKLTACFNGAGCPAYLEAIGE